VLLVFSPVWSGTRHRPSRRVFAEPSSKSLSIRGRRTSAGGPCLRFCFRVTMARSRHGVNNNGDSAQQTADPTFSTIV